MSVLEYIENVNTAIATRNGAHLRNLLTINPGADLGLKRAKFQDPSDIDFFHTPPRVKPVVNAYLETMRAVYVRTNIDKSFAGLLLLVASLNRYAEQELSWVCDALTASTHELLSVHQVRSKGKKDEKALEQLAEVVKKLFQLCLTDKNEDVDLLKKPYIYFFLAALFKIYFKLNHIEPAKATEMVLTQTGLASPKRLDVPRAHYKHVVTYLYYSSLLALDEGKFASAQTRLELALEYLACYTKPKKARTHAERILMLLVPLRLYNSRQKPSERVWLQHPTLAHIYRNNLLAAISEGNLQRFEACLRRYRGGFLKRHIYLLAVQLKLQCQLALVRKTCLIYAEMAENPHIVPFSAFQLAFDYSQNHTLLQAPELVAKKHYAVSEAEVQCVLANLIARKYVKGYLSHSNRCIVVLKSNAFPR